MLRGDAKLWCDAKIQLYGEEQSMSLTWDEFKSKFFKEYGTPADISRLKDELRALKQGSMDLNTLKSTFLSKTQFCPEYVRNDHMLMEDFYRALNDDLKNKISRGSVDSFEKLFEVSKGFETLVPKGSGFDFSKRKFKATMHSNKKSKSATEGVGSVKMSDTSGFTFACYNCGQTGHKSRDCPSGKVTCFKCRKEGHQKLECPELISNRVWRSNVA
ncbi:uncharacterized protein [Rutidosis leptorrhynchoides]|uniref:uncharacterized protein n=1 Tax=Rutidosis leptorrhynchoides TaxID=125765 RepID=UPI003A993537